MKNKNRSQNDEVEEELILLGKRWKKAFFFASKWIGRTNYMTDLDQHTEAALGQADFYLSKICATPAASFPGVVIKLCIALEWARLMPSDMEDPPWRCVESALADLQRIVGDSNDYLS